jgi:hypothetical protein
MNTLSTKLSALAAALIMNSLIMGAVGYLFEVQSRPQSPVAAVARDLGTHQWLTIKAGASEEAGGQA